MLAGATKERGLQHWQQSIENYLLDEKFIKEAQENRLIRWFYRCSLYRTLKYSLRWNIQTVRIGRIVISDVREIKDDDREAVLQLAERATLAIKDHAIQKQVIESLSALQTEVDYLQNIRAASSFNVDKLKNIEQPELPEGMATWVKDALTHYWGGPKLTNNPLMQLKVVEEESENQMATAPTRLRSVLTEAIEMIKTSGERKFTMSGCFTTASS